MTNPHTDDVASRRPADVGAGGRSFAGSLRALRSAQKPGAGVPLYTRYVNRPMGRVIAAAAAQVRLTPHQVTAISAVITLVGLVLAGVLAPTVPAALSITLLLVVGYAFDSADGQLARLTGGGSPAGEWLDHVVDAARNPGMHLAIAVSLFRFGDVDARWLLVPLLFSLVTGVRFFALILAEQVTPVPVGTASGSSGGLLGSLIQLPSDTGVLNLVFVLLPWPRLFLAVYTLLFGLNTLLMGASLVRKFRALNDQVLPRREDSR